MDGPIAFGERAYEQENLSSASAPCGLDAFVEQFNSSQFRTSEADKESFGEALRFARQLIKLRRQREMTFGTNFFGEPVWDMLLDLFVAKSRQKRVAVSSLCIAAVVPTTTAMRWIETMEGAGLCSRYPDPNDKRRTFVALTEDAMTRMINLLCGAASRN
jgi:DNA-binding MarR family transcriptional regulator